MENKYCRICWNTAGWQKPSNDAAHIETGKSYVAQNQFGHEEWLFNYEWLINGCRYGFLQPIGKHYPKYTGKSCSIVLYTISPEKKILLVGRLQDVHVPTENELAKVLRIADEQGWLDEMRESVALIGGNVGVLQNPEPREIFNIRFRPENVEIFDPKPRVVGKHKITTPPHWYQLYNWEDDDDLETSSLAPSLTVDDPRRSEELQIRAAQRGVIVDPKHVRLQNRLYETLCLEHGANNVDYEANFVDLTVRSANRRTFFEIKTDQTVRRCIRNAIGQLLDYAYYPNGEERTSLVVVGDAPITSSDKDYLAHLRQQFGLDIYYSRFLWETNTLDEKI